MINYSSLYKIQKLKLKVKSVLWTSYKVIIWLILIPVEIIFGIIDGFRVGVLEEDTLCF